MTQAEKMNKACEKMVAERLKKNRLATRDFILLVVAIFLAVFIVYTVVFYSLKGWQWDGIFPYVLGLGGVVDVMTALIALRNKDKESD